MTRRLAVGASLAVGAVGAEAVGALAARGVEPLLLKGPPLARALYGGDTERGSGDVDLLVTPSDLPVARAVLSELGYERATWGVQARDVHAEVWRREASVVSVDLHVSLPGVAARPEEVFAVLAASTRVESLGEVRVRVPAGEGLALVVALHAAAHGPDSGKPLRDLDLAIRRLPDEDWQRAAALARRLVAEPAFRAGLGLARARDAVDVAPADVTLRAIGAPHTAVGFERLARTPGLAAKLRHLLETAFPPPEVVRGWHPAARRGRLGLVAAYVMRLAWLARWAPAGFRAWLRARRDIHSSRGGA